LTLSLLSIGQNNHVTTMVGLPRPSSPGSHASDTASSTRHTPLLTVLL
jgi:hypothetical protein